MRRMRQEGIPMMTDDEDKIHRVALKKYTCAVYVSQTANLPTETHYAILRNTTTDDGYGGRSPAITYTAYLTQEELEAEVQRLSSSAYGHEPFKVLAVTPLAVKQVVEIQGLKGLK